MPIPVGSFLLSFYYEEDFMIKKIVLFFVLIFPYLSYSDDTEDLAINATTTNAALNGSTENFINFYMNLSAAQKSALLDKKLNFCRLLLSSTSPPKPEDIPLIVCCKKLVPAMQGLLDIHAQIIRIAAIAANAAFNPTQVSGEDFQKILASSEKESETLYPRLRALVNDFNHFFENNPACTQVSSNDLSSLLQLFRRVGTLVEVDDKIIDQSEKDAAEEDARRLKNAVIEAFAQLKKRLGF